MARKAAAELSPGLVAVKGDAQAPTDATGRAQEQDKKTATAVLNFKVDPEFRRRFRQRALDADLKHNQLLRQALAAWEEKHGIR